MTSRELEEYKALRQTIRDRGTARHWMVLVGFTAWAGLVVAETALATPPALTLVPLFVLAATFEVIFALHTGVERVGRYLAVFHEEPTEPAAWERVAVEYGRAFKGGGIDALFCPLFWAATILNLIPAAIASPVGIEWAVVGLAHACLIWRTVSARGQAATQRATDFDRFTQLRKQVDR